MSGIWSKAGGRTALYRSDVPARGDGAASNLVTRTVLRDLCWWAHDAGVATVYTATIAERVGVSRSTVIRALARLERDGWVTRAVRGTGNRVGVGTRASVYVLRPLPDVDGNLHPEPQLVAERWPAYAVSHWFLPLSRGNRAAVRMAHQAALNPVENVPPDGSNYVPALNQLSVSPDTPIQVEEELEPPVPRVHPRAAARARHRLTVAAKEPS